MLIECIGKLNFKAEIKTKKQIEQSSWKRNAMIDTECDLERYYAWFLEKRYGLTLNKTLRGTHITIIADKVDFDKFDEVANIYHEKEIKFYYDNEGVRGNGTHWWLKVECDVAKDIRELMGLDREPYFSFHLTLGYANDRNLNHSEYILRTMKLFNPI